MPAVRNHAAHLLIAKARAAVNVKHAEEVRERRPVLSMPPGEPKVAKRVKIHQPAASLAHVQLKDPLRKQLSEPAAGAELCHAEPAVFVSIQLQVQLVRGQRAAR